MVHVVTIIVVILIIVLSGIFELRNYRLHPGTVPAWQKTYSAGFALRTKYSSPIGMWFSEIGSLNESKYVANTI